MKKIKSPNIPKNKFPHLYTMQSLGGYDTKEGSDYILIHHDEIESEYELYRTILWDRVKIGVIDKIHPSYSETRGDSLRSMESPAPFLEVK